MRVCISIVIYCSDLGSWRSFSGLTALKASQDNEIGGHVTVEKHDSSLEEDVEKKQ